MGVINSEPKLLPIFVSLFCRARQKHLKVVKDLRSHFVPQNLTSAVAIAAPCSCPCCAAHRRLL
jgi:hypothetical protein